MQVSFLLKFPFNPPQLLRDRFNCRSGVQLRQKNVSVLYLRNVGSSVVVVSMKDGRNSLGVISLLMGALEPPATLTGLARVAAASAGTWKVVSALTTRQGTRVGLLTVDPNPKFGLGCVCEMENRSG